MSKRRQRNTYLRGFSVRLDPEHIGIETPMLVIRGRTEAGNLHKVLVTVDDCVLRSIVADVRRHFTKRTENENAHRAWREQAFQQGAG